MNAVPEAVAIIDHDGAIVRTNPRLCELFGYQQADELRGQPVEALIPEPVHSVSFGRRKDGSEFPVELNLAPIRALDRPMTVGVVRDISERLWTERHLRTALEDQAARLRAFDHGIRNQLHMLMSLLSLEAQDLQDPRSRGPVDIVRQRVAVIALIHGLAARSSTGSPSVDVGVFFHEFAPQVAQTLERESFEVWLDIDLKTLVVNMDRAVGLGLLLNEVAGGCLKHPPADSVNRFLAIGLTTAGGVIELSFRDRGGKGITPLSWTRSGSGFMVVRGLVTRLQGTLEVREGGAQGAAVVVRVPVRLGAEG